MSPQPLQFLLLLFAGWLNRKQLDVIEYLKEENKILREQLGERPLRLNDNQRRRLAIRGTTPNRAKTYGKGCFSAVSC